MSDAISITDNSGTIVGLKNKNADVKKMEILNPGKTFADIAQHKDKTAIEALASRGIINGKTENGFEPESTMTRAEFATLVVKALKLEDGEADFDDVNDEWFAFNDKTLTREERFRAAFNVAKRALVDENGVQLLTDDDYEAIKVASFQPLMRIWNYALDPDHIDESFKKK